MIKDPIVEDVRKEREAHAAKFDYNIDEIFKDLKEEERKNNREFVKLPPRHVKKPA